MRKTLTILWFGSACWQAAAAQPGDGFAAVGARATLSVEYRFEAKGGVKDSPDGAYQQRDWRVARSADVVAELVARKPAPIAMMQAAEAAQVARLQQQGAQVQNAATQMAPMMATAEAIAARCNNDEKCIEREVMRMGAAMAGTQQLEETQRVGRQAAAALKPDADRYQHWLGQTQKASYSLDESWHVVYADPICMRLASARCTHDMLRKGGGDMPPVPSTSMVEVDVQAQTMVLLPVPMAALAYAETHTSDEPVDIHNGARLREPQHGQLLFRVTSDGKSNPAPIKVALKGGWRSQSGEQVVAMGAGGKLVLRWRFTAQ